MLNLNSKIFFDKNRTDETNENFLPRNVSLKSKLK